MRGNYTMYSCRPQKVWHRVPARIGEVVVSYDIMPSKDRVLQDEVWFHPKCWRKQSSSDRYATRIVGRWVAINRAVERAGSKGVPIKQITMLTQINRSFVSEYLRKIHCQKCKMRQWKENTLLHYLVEGPWQTEYSALSVHG